MRRRFVAGCVDGYRLAYPRATIVLTLPEGEAPLIGGPELFAQMVDKLVANAVEFSTGARSTSYGARDGNVYLRVSNDGPPLPPEIADRLFDSMVSSRPQRGTPEAREPHLGLGLYIVRLVAAFHGGVARAVNRDGESGVEVTVALPLAN
jgi:signal transduction histidine kinase